MKALLNYVDSNTSVEVLMLLLFVGTFLGMGFWVYRRSAKQKYKDQSLLPLED